MADDWTDLIGVADLTTGWVTRVDLGARPLAVYHTPTGIYVSLALCNHGGADLCDGYMDGHLIECPLHQGAFDVRTGAPIGAPATRAMKTFPVRIENGRVQIRLKG
ncbi:non-heme iron oxygenase ferredoxin subunit [Oceaniglobus ichthyenteri]|uniref:non-heme iron oxygenase ferredoxin subunit n=1 Tax=Oceaniglobus ichthyenteri TaxID=2136177 RepID=UPI000D3A91E4|nr:non-heme iron oxygenase ferredoxin subunit [Oceaniglobus ichthyenteri]